MCEEPDGPYFYAVALEQDQELIAGLEQELASVVQAASESEQSVASAEMDSSVAKDVFEALAARVQGISYARMTPKKDDSVSAEKRELVKAMRERVKSLLGTLPKNISHPVRSSGLQNADRRTQRCASWWIWRFCSEKD